MKLPQDNQRGTVYSTESGRMCPRCGKPIGQCECRQHSKPAGGDGIVRVSRSTAGRKGKGVTIISGLALDHDAMKCLAKELKNFCGAGGTVKEGCIEIQGDHRDRISTELSSRGFTVKKAGG